jgi:hypothetical protein
MNTEGHDNLPSHRPPTQRDLDPHLRRYAQRTAGMTASEIRALFAALETE